MKAIAEIAKDCLELPSSQRLQLARILLDDTEPGHDFSLEVACAWEDEISARVTAVVHGTAKSRPMADVFAELDQRYSSLNCRAL